MNQEFKTEIRKKMEGLPVTPNAYLDSFGNLPEECRTLRTMEEAFHYVIDFLVEISAKGTNVRDWRIESTGILGQGDWIRVIFFHSQRGMDFFDGVNIARIDEDKFLIKRVS